ncbi:TPA: response regulator, partial [Candidatus Poribacteria bacterium]|nr:response regulator [Candidatus Poribacteria bacterium]HEX29637.1 response regulator [Candidatus Poribacteria bacterium]
MEGRGEPITILLVDDDEDCRLMIRDAIEEAGVQNNVYE